MDICWAPECANPLGATKPKGQPRRYCSGACRIRAIRRNGGKAPSEPYPPLAASTPLHQDAPGVTVAVQLEQQAAKPTRVKPAVTLAAGGSDVAGKARKERRDSVQPPAVATAGTAPAPAAPPQGAAALPRVAAPTQDKAPTEQPPAGTAPGAVADPAPGYPESSAEDLDPKAPTVPIPVPKHPLVEAYRADLTALGKQDSVDGLKILEMAGKLVSASSSPAASANLSKELDRLLADLKTAAQPKGESDPFNAIRERTLRKLGVVGVRERLPA